MAGLVCTVVVQDVELRPVGVYVVLAGSAITRVAHHQQCCLPCACHRRLYPAGSRIGRPMSVIVLQGRSPLMLQLQVQLGAS